MRDESLVPLWLKPMAAIVAAAIHCAIFFGLGQISVAAVPQISPISIEVLALGEVTDVLASEASLKQEAVDSSPAPDQPAPSLQPVSDDLPTMERQLPKTPAEERSAKSVPRAKPSQQKSSQQKNVAETRAKTRGNPLLRREGDAGGRSSYGALVSAEINRHKRYPDAARTARAQGSVTLAFVVGSAGRIVSHAIVRSSGNAAIDMTARQMMASAVLPPPPGGRFSSRISIRFHLSQ